MIDQHLLHVAAQRSDSSGRPRSDPVCHSVPTLIRTEMHQGHHHGQEVQSHSAVLTDTALEHQSTYGFGPVHFTFLCVCVCVSTLSSSPQEMNLFHLFILISIGSPHSVTHPQLRSQIWLVTGCDWQTESWAESEWNTITWWMMKSCPVYQLHFQVQLLDDSGFKTLHFVLLDLKRF